MEARGPSEERARRTEKAAAPSGPSADRLKRGAGPEGGAGDRVPHDPGRRPETAAGDRITWRDAPPTVYRSEADALRDVQAFGQSRELAEQRRQSWEAGREMAREGAARAREWAARGEQPVPESSRQDVAHLARYAQWVRGPGDVRYCETSGWLADPRAVKVHRDGYAQSVVAGRTGDDAGHLGPNRFGFAGGFEPGGLENLARQDRAVNRGEQKRVEDYWEARVKAGVQVYVTVTDVYKVDEPGFGRERPVCRNLRWVEVHPSGEAVGRSQVFENPAAPSRHRPAPGPGA